MCMVSGMRTYNIGRDMYNNEVGKEGVWVCEAHEVK